MNAQQCYVFSDNEFPSVGFRYFVSGYLSSGDYDLECKDCRLTGSLYDVFLTFKSFTGGYRVYDTQEGFRRNALFVGMTKPIISNIDLGVNVIMGKGLQYKSFIGEMNLFKNVKINNQLSFQAYLGMGIHENVYGSLGIGVLIKPFNL